jgi:hypothetical protein
MAIQYVIPVGCDSFRELTTLTSTDCKKSLFVDKTRFIKEVLDEGAKIILITRPRRFGKTINMSMLQHFLAAEVDGQPTKDLFNGLLISQDQAAMSWQGKYPVIFISLKEVKAENFIAARSVFAEVLRVLYEKFRYVEDTLSIEQKEIYTRILRLQATNLDLQRALLNLSGYLYKIHQEKVYLLIDEYDTPIQHAYAKEYYDEMVTFLRDLLGSSLKGNAWIKQGILTGITRIAKESIFSELNNPKTRSLLDNKHAAYFGFTEDEVNDLFSRSGLDCDVAQLKTWYNGYQCGDTLLYNPWSIMNSLDDGGALKQYWINTSGNDLAIELIIKGGVEIYEKLEVLLQNETILENLDEHIVYKNINKNRAAIWTLLLMTGYLKVVSSPTAEGSNKYELALPNKEVRYFYQNAIQIWLSDRNGAMWYQNFLEDLLAGKLLNFEKKLLQIVQATFSVRDVENHEPEKFYHAFMLGLLATLQNSHDITSNREAGLGYDDFLIIPKDVSKNGVILEFKAPKDATEANLVKEAAIALEQIKKKKYAMELEMKGVKNIISIGIAFAKKDVRICFEKSWIKPMGVI